MRDHITLPNEPFLDDPFKRAVVTGDEYLVNQSHLIGIFVSCFNLSNIGIGEQGIPDIDIISNALFYFLDGDRIVEALG